MKNVVIDLKSFFLIFGHSFTKTKGMAYEYRQDRFCAVNGFSLDA
jgi:hypothetical protein